MRIVRAAAWALVVAAVPASQLTAAGAAGAACESLKTLSLDAGSVTLAETVPAGGFRTPGSTANAQDAGRFGALPAFCRVAATLRPSADSDITVEVWMPQSGWNGKFEAVGNGGWAGTISYPAMAQALAHGYATTSTDTGHSTPGAAFALGHPDKLADYAYRSEHEMTVAGKAVVRAFYGSAPTRAYFNGCSTGGRQALTEASRYPGDFDGIVAGAAANPKTHLDTWRIWMGLETMTDPESRIPQEKYPAIHQAVLAACDAKDGVTDGLLEDPTQCHFNPQVLACTGTDTVSCLTPKQVKSVATVLGPARSRTGTEIFPGYMPGSELMWGRLIGGPAPYETALDQFRFTVFNDPTWDWRTFDVDRDLAKAEQALKGLLTSIDPKSIAPFAERGGKLLMYHGWADQDIAPLASVNFYKNVTQALGNDKASSALRLFMVPGMGHCGGGDGPNTFDMMPALEAWVEQGQAPARVIASHSTKGAVDRTRPLCPYPQVARYNGTGSIDAAENFTCRLP